MAASREIYASGVTIEHFMMGCLLSSFQGKFPQVQSMMVNDINSDKVGPGMQMEELVSNYSTSIATMNSINGPSRGIKNAGLKANGKKGGDAKFKGKCNNCGKMGHKSKDCRAQKKNPVGQVQEKPKCDKKGWCKYCMRGPHKEDDCYSKKAGKAPHPDSKCTPAKPVQAATVAQGWQRTTKDLSQEQLSNLFKDLVSGAKVLPIAVPGAIPDAYAPTLQDVESELCHPKKCGQPKARKVSKGTQSATLVKSDEPDEPRGHQDPDPEQLMLGTTSSQSPKSQSGPPGPSQGLWGGPRKP